MNRQDYYTTGQAAKAANVSQQTIIRRIDNGSLKGVRIGRTGKHRRIYHSELVRFIIDDGHPWPFTDISEPEYLAGVKSDETGVAHVAIPVDLLKRAGRLLPRDSDERAELATYL